MCGQKNEIGLIKLILYGAMSKRCEIINQGSYIMYIQLYEYLNDFTCIIAFYNIFDQIS